MAKKETIKKKKNEEHDRRIIDTPGANKQTIAHIEDIENNTKIMEERIKKAESEEE